MMKGYEDLLTERLSRDHPDEGAKLKRNKTPKHCIAISEKPEDGQGNGKKRGAFWRRTLIPPDTQEKDNQRAVDNEVAESPAEGQESNTGVRVSPSEGGDGGKEDEKGDGDGSIQEQGEKVVPAVTVMKTSRKDTPLTPLENLRRMSLSFPNNNSNSLCCSRGALVESQFGSPRKSFPNSEQTSTLPYTRRLVLSYRMESAMDILDKIKPETELPLSPRVKGQMPCPHISQPVREFNRWSTQWATEFKRHAVD